MVLKTGGVLEPPLSESPIMSSLDGFGDVLGDRCAFWALFCFLVLTRVYSAPSLAAPLEPLEPLEPGYLESMLLGGLVY